MEWGTGMVAVALMCLKKGKQRPSAMGVKYQSYTYVVVVEISHFRVNSLWEWEEGARYFPYSLAIY